MTTTFRAARTRQGAAPAVSRPSRTIVTKGRL